MAYVINDDCINCGACAAGCPVEAISEGASHMEINADVYTHSSFESVEKAFEQIAGNL